MKKLFKIMVLPVLLCSILLGCSPAEKKSQIVATTLPVYCFTRDLCEGTSLQVSQLVNEPVSCLHNYTLQVSQMRTVESAQILVMNGAGFEGFLHDVITTKENVIDASAHLELDCSQHHHHNHMDSEDSQESHSEHNGHNHSYDAHIWMSPQNAMVMVKNISNGLQVHFPDVKASIQENEQKLLDKLSALQEYGEAQLAELRSRDLITFHDGFHYFAKSFHLNVLKAIEEEPGSETSAAELKDLISFVRSSGLPAIFTEENGSTASADVIASETGCKVYKLNMIMYGTDYFSAMYQNIDTIKEALG